jgi:RNA recognition motif-containing protein
MGTKLYVGNLSFDTTENDIQDLFAEVGTVREAVLIQDKMTGKSRGFGFVTMSTDEEAQNATQRLNGKDIARTHYRERSPSPGRLLAVRPTQELGGGGAVETAATPRRF